MFNIQNDWLDVVIKTKGAELERLFSKKHQLEYMWNGDPAFWSKTSPVLFPIVGTLKDNRYYHDGRLYEMSRHGFARDSEFLMVDQTGSSVRFSLSANEHTFRNYPFPFRFDIQYSLLENSLNVLYSVRNAGAVMMYFSVGGHPAFRVPLVTGLTYNDYFLAFDTEETAPRWPISKDGLIEAAPQPLLENTTRLPLTKSLFFNDAIVLKGLSSKTVTLKSDKDSHGLHFDFTGFPFLGLWAASNADFLCIEPWCGIADAVGSNQQLAQKEGIIGLGAGELFERTWKVEVF